MRAVIRPWFLATVFGLSGVFTEAADKVTYVSDVLPILRNSCLNCHNPDKRKAGLDMTTYQGLMDGSDSGKVIEPGNPGNSLLLKLISHTEEPAMPPKSDKLPDSQINVIRKWIEGYALETTDSKAAIAKSSAPALEMFAADQASGPPPMPHDLLLEPALQTARVGAVVSLAASPRAPIVAVAGQKQVLLYDVNNRELAGVLPFPEGFPDIVKFSRDGRLLIAGGGVGARSGRVVVWDITTGDRVLEVGDEYDEVLAADISTDHRFIALGGPNRRVKIFRDGKLLYNIKKHTDWVTALAFTSDGKMLVSGDRQGGLSVWETATGEEIFTLPSHKAGVTALAAPAPQACLSASEDGTIKIWDLREGKEVKSWNAHGGGVMAAAFASDGRIVSCGRDNTVKLWNRDGGKLKDFEAFGDVALSAVACQDKIVAGDWTGKVQVWNADGKRIGELSPNPPMLSDRLAGVNARLEDLAARHEKAVGSLADAEKAAARSSEEARAAAQLSCDKEKQVKAAEELVAALSKSSGEAVSILKKSKADYAQLQSVSTKLSTDLSKAVAANDAALSEEKLLEGSMQEKQTHADQLAEAAKTAQAQADKQPDNQSLADAAAKAKADADKAKEDLTTATAKVAESQRTKEALAKANDAVAANKDSVSTMQHAIEAQSATVEKLGADLEASKKKQAATKKEFDEIAKNLPPKASRAQAAEEALSKAKREVEELDHALAHAKGELAKWNAAKVNVSLHAARKELVARQVDYAKAQEEARQAAAELDKARADLAGAEKALAEAPQRIKEKEQAISQSREDQQKAAAVSVEARESVAQKEALVAAASDFASKTDVMAAKSPEDATLKDAAAKAKESLDLLNRDLAAARQSAASLDAAAVHAGKKIAAAEKALADTKADISNAPANIAKLKAVAEEVTARTKPARMAAENRLAEAGKPVAAAQQKVDTLTGEYQSLIHEAVAADPSFADLTKK